MKLGKKSKNILLAAVFTLLLTSNAQATPTPSIESWVPGLKAIAVSMAWLLMIVMGIRWIIADSPNDRADAKKGIMYIVVGMLLVSMYCNLLQLLCDTFMPHLEAGYTFTCSFPDC